MIKVITVIIVVRVYWLFKTNNWITNHFGKNPINGGRPPKDSKFRNNINFKIFELKNELNNWLIWYILKLLKINVKLKDKNV